MNNLHQPTSPTLVWLNRLFIPLAFIIALLLANSINRGSAIKSVIWADMEGYYLYLPGIFIYGDFKNMPHRKCCGINEDGQIVTKYTYGVALLESPFFFASHLIAKAVYDPSNQDESHQAWWKPDGYAHIYAWGIILAGIFYSMMGLLFLKSLLSKYFETGTVLLTLFLIFFGTNLLYYSIRESGASHAFSLFAFSGFLRFLPGWLEKPGLKRTVLLSLFAGLLVLIRPVNIVMLLMIPGWEIYRFPDLKNRIKKLLRKEFILSLAGMAVIGFLIMLPQFFYWNEFYGSPLSYTYTDEYFYWLRPKIFHIWFSYQNGWLAYTFLGFFMLAGVITTTLKRKHSGPAILFIFLTISYILSCWHIWWFGGALGFRPMIEYYALFSIPLAYIVGKILCMRKKWIKALSIMLLIFLVYANIKMTFLYKYPWSGDDWTLSSYYDKVIEEVLLFWESAHKHH